MTKTYQPCWKPTTSLALQTTWQWQAFWRMRTSREVRVRAREATAGSRKRRTMRAPRRASKGYHRSRTHPRITAIRKPLKARKKIAPIYHMSSPMKMTIRFKTQKKQVTTMLIPSISLCLIKVWRAPNLILAPNKKEESLWTQHFLEQLACLLLLLLTITSLVFLKPNQPSQTSKATAIQAKLAVPTKKGS